LKLRKVTKIYLVENCYGDPNKIYIGKTINSRKYNHKKTYGDQIIYTFIDEVDSLDRKNWEPLETYWIEQFKQWGFEIVNKRKKGGMGPEFLSKEAKEKKSKAMLGKTHSKETCLKISQSLKGNKRPKEIGEKISNSKKGKPINLVVSSSHKNKLKNIHSIPIIQYDINGNFIKEWSSTQEAASFYNTQKGHICNVLNGRAKSSNGYKWKYKNI
jgi:hypothetical protein